MGNAALNYNPYGMSNSGIRSERSIEYQAFARVTSMLSSAARAGKENVGDLAEALHENRRLWNILAADVMLDSNSLPAELRASIVSLSQFVAGHSTEVLAGTKDIDALIDINKAIMRGLDKG